MIYFDNAASTKPYKEALEKYLEISLSAYANPSSGSGLGMQAEKVLKNAGTILAKHINAEDYNEIYFTSGGTESNNIAVFGTAKGYHRSGKHIITTAIEHPAITLPFEELKEEGFEVQIIEVDEKGYINLDSLKNSIRQDTILVSTIFINNEIGTIQDIETIGKIVKETNINTIYHVDAVQAFGKEKIDVKKCRIDMLSASGHKFGAPKGLGFLYLRKGLKVKPIMFGGGQQNNLRPGTENPGGAAALAISAQMCYTGLEEKKETVRNIKRYLCESILKEIEGTFLNGEKIEKSSPYVLNIGFKDLRSPILLNALEEKDIYVSAGSACNSRKKVQSSVLEAMGMEFYDINGSIRFSFSHLNTMEEAESCFKALKDIVPILRRFNRKR